MNVSFTNGDKTVSLKDFLDFMNKRLLEHDTKTFPNLTINGPYHTLEVEIGRKYIRLVSVTGIGTGQKHRSAYGFLDFQGNIYKTASWRAPAKHIRGPIFDDNYGWGTALGVYGVRYMR